MEAVMITETSAKQFTSKRCNHPETGPTIALNRLEDVGSNDPRNVGNTIHAYTVPSSHQRQQYGILAELSLDEPQITFPKSGYSLRYRHDLKQQPA
jgi:hypothetical protein